jgi:PST family polysaccharide transporter
MVTNWGFAISGTNKIAAHRNDLDRVSDIFLTSWAAQWLLCGCAILLLSLLIVLVPFFQQRAQYLVWGIGLIVSSVLFPVWFLNGLEKMKQAAVIQIGSRVIEVPLIFLLIKRPEDAPFMLAIGTATGIVGGFVTLVWIKKSLCLTWRWPRLESIFRELRDGASMFASTVWISLYTTLTPTILGLLAGNAAVGYYALADRARQLVQSALGPISQALFPRMSYLFMTNIQQAKSLLWRSAKFIILISAIGSLTLWILAEFIVITLAGEQFRPSIAVLRWLAPLPFIISLSNILGIQIMLPNHKTRAFNWILGVAGFLSLCAISPLIFWKGAEGAAINTFIIECFVTTAMAFYLWKTDFFFTKNLRVKHES